MGAKLYRSVEEWEQSAMPEPGATVSLVEVTFQWHHALCWRQRSIR